MRVVNHHIETVAIQAEVASGKSSIKKVYNNIRSEERLTTNIANPVAWV